VTGLRPTIDPRLSHSAPASLWSLSRLALASVLLACSTDVVLPDQTIAATCGNGVVEPGEPCDVASPGCVECAVVPTWTCDQTTCRPICGDGVVGQGALCAQPRRDSDCDLTGYWAARETDFTREAILGSIQTSSNWFLYRFEQSGDDFHVTEALDCGVHVTGSAKVDYSPGTLRGLIYKSRMEDAASPHGARHGTSKAVAGGCAITLDRWYKVRGATDAFLPADFTKQPALASLPALPSVRDPAVGGESPTGADDPDADGIPGTGFTITGIVSGIRNSAQRDWKEYATTSTAPAPAAALTFAIPGAFDLQENVLRVSECGSACGLLASPAHPAADRTPRLTLSFIGKTLGSQRVAEIVTDATRRSLDSDLTTCAKVRLALPHDGSTR
jgi:hypothetical protein